MNDDELDLLASAYLDGEATPDEVAMVERDPELLARVEEFRAIQVDGSITPPAGLVDQHVAEAMEEWFEAISSTGATSAAAATASETANDIEDDTAGEIAPVVDLAAASARRSERRARPAPRRTMPSWLPAAAGFVIVGGGLVWAFGQTGGSDDADTTAEVAIAADDSAEDTESANESAELDDAEGEAMAAMAQDEATEESEEAMEEESADESSRSDDAGADAAAPADGDSDDDAAEDAADAEAEFADPVPLLFFDEIPDVDAIIDLPEPEADLERSVCGPEVVAPTLGEPLGFIPVEIQGEPAELYLFQDGDGADIRRLVDNDCQPIELP